jgi:hypothetical protein
MLAAIPVNEMAETLRVLAGDNAVNAARHFTKRSFDMGDVSSAVLWSSIAQCLGVVPPAAAEPNAVPADPATFDDIRGGIAMQGVRYEDVDAETLAREERTPISLAPIPRRARAPKQCSLVRSEKPAAEQSPKRAAAAIEFAQAA